MSLQCCHLFISWNSCPFALCHPSTFYLAMSWSLSCNCQWVWSRVSTLSQTSRTALMFANIYHLALSDAEYGIKQLLSWRTNILSIWLYTLTRSNLLGSWQMSQRSLSPRSGSCWCMTKNIHRQYLVIVVVLSGLEWHRHLDDMPPSPPDASARAGDTLPRNVKDVYKRRRDAHRVRGTYFHHWDWSHHSSSPEWTADLFVYICLDCVLRWVWLLPCSLCEHAECESNWTILPPCQSLSPQVTTLWVAMGRGWLKQTADEISTTLVFAKPATIHEQSQGVHRTIYNTEGPISGSETPMNKLDTSIKEQMSITNVVSFA